VPAHGPVKNEETDIFGGLILECHIVRDHNGSVKGKTENNPIPEEKTLVSEESISNK